MDKISENAVVLKPNPILMGRLSDQFTSRELDVFTLLFSIYDLRAVNKRIIQLNTSELLRVLGITDGGDNYKMIDAVTTGLLNKAIFIRSNKGDFAKYNLFTMISFRRKDAYIEFRLSPDILPFIDDIHQYTKYALRNFLELRNIYSKRLYELAVRFRGKNGDNEEWWHYIEIAEYRALLCVPEGDYPRYGNFKVRCIDDPIEDINLKTDITLQYEEVKRGRRVFAIRLIAKNKQKHQEAEALTTTNAEVLASLQGYGVNLSTSQKFAEKYELKYIEFVMKKVEQYATREEVRDKPALLITYINKEMYLDEFQHEQEILRKKEEEKARKIRINEIQKILDQTREQYYTYVRAAIESYALTASDDLTERFFDLISRTKSEIVVRQAQKHGLMSPLLRAEAIDYLNKDGANILKIDEFYTKKGLSYDGLSQELKALEGS